MTDIATRVIKVPVRILEEDEGLRIWKYRALDEMMHEARLLANTAIRYAIAFRLDGIPAEIDPGKGTPVHLDTRIYRILIGKKRYLNASTVATLSRNFALKVLRKIDKEAWEGKKSLPTCRSLFVPFRHQGSRLSVLADRDGLQFLIEPSFGRNWLSDPLAAMLGIDSPVANARRGLALASCLSQKDRGAGEILRRIASGQYPLGDSQLTYSGRKLMALLTYRMKQVRPAPDRERICGVFLGAAVPAACAVNFGPERLFLGSQTEVWAAQSKFRAERRRNKRSSRPGPGEIRWARSEKEERWLHTYCHALTRQVIRFCQQHGCGTIRLEAPEIPRRGLPWSNGKRLVQSPSMFIKLLDYKAGESGIRIVKFPAGDGAGRCSACGHQPTADGETPPVFVCDACGFKSHADYNAARNLCVAAGDGDSATLAGEAPARAVSSGGAIR